MEEVSVVQVMSPNVDTVPPHCPVQDLMELMWRQRISCLVVSEKERPIGIVTGGDVSRARADALGAAFGRPYTAARIMTSPVVSIPASARVGDAVALLRRRRVSRLPVVDEEGRLVGLARRDELLDAHVRRLEATVAELRRKTEGRFGASLPGRFTPLSSEDPLLGIGSRAALEHDLERLHEAALRYRRQYTVVRLQVDAYPDYAAGYGASAADRLLQEVAARLGVLLRGSDALYRAGPADLLALLPETGAQGARVAAERLVAAVEQLAIPHMRSPLSLATVSGGVATFAPEDRAESRWQSVVERAESALARACDRGGNRAEVG